MPWLHTNLDEAIAEAAELLTRYRQRSTVIMIDGQELYEALTYAEKADLSPDTRSRQFATVQHYKPKIHNISS